MTKKYVRSHPNNIIEKTTGLRTIQLSGKSRCLVTPKDTHKKEPIKHLAYRLYNGYDKLPDNSTIKSVCGVDQCISSEHLINVTI